MGMTYKFCLQKKNFTSLRIRTVLSPPSPLSRFVPDVEASMIVVRASTLAINKGNKISKKI